MRTDRSHFILMNTCVSLLSSSYSDSDMSTVVILFSGRIEKMSYLCDIYDINASKSAQEKKYNVLQGTDLFLLKTFYCESK